MAKAPEVMRYHTMSVTPFNKRGTVDEGALKAHLERLALAGNGVFLASVGTGEAKLLSREEIRRVYQVGVKVLKGKVPVYAAGLGLNETALVIDMANEALAIGVDAAYIYGPRTGEANTPTRQEIDQFFADIFTKVKGPVLPANNTTVISYQVPQEVFQGLALKHGRSITAFPSADPNFFYNVRLIDAVKPKPVYTSMTTQLLSLLPLGIRGALGHEGNVAPRLCQSIFDAWTTKDYGRAAQSYATLMRLGVVLAKYGNPRSQKAALEILGLPSSNPRRPYLPLDAAARKELASVLDELEIRKIEGLS